MYTVATFAIGRYRPDGSCDVPAGAEDKLKQSMLRLDGPLRPVCNSDVSVEFADRSETVRRSCGAVDTTGARLRVCTVTFNYRMGVSAARSVVAEAISKSIDDGSVDITVAHLSSRPSATQVA